MVEKELVVFSYTCKMEAWFEVLLLFIIGFTAGLINTLAGGGSLLTLPALIFYGLPPTVANATNRIGVFFNAVFAVRGFQSKGYQPNRYAFYLGLISLIGAFLGSLVAVDVKGETFNKILAGVIVIIVAYMLFGKKTAIGNTERMSGKHKVWGYFSFFVVGLYGGFIQAGVGYLIMASLSLIHHMPLVKVNLIKAFVVVIYTFAAMGVFLYNDLIDWKLGLTLAVGMSFGGWFTSRWSTGINEKYVRYFVMVTAVGFAIKLAFF